MLEPAGRNRKNRRPDAEAAQAPDRGGRLTEAAKARLARDRASVAAVPDQGDRYSTWDSAERGPHPRPHWVITAAAAVDTELGVLKTGKEADVHLVQRSVPGSQAAVVMAAKRYRSGEHRLFHRDAGYLEGRRMRRSRESRAMANRSSFGRNLIAEQWAAAEFGALSTLWSLGAAVPYPVQRDGIEVLMEFIGDEDGVAAPRLAGTRPTSEELEQLWRSVLDSMMLLAQLGLAHGDLSPYNVLVHNDTPVLIDLPQLVDLVANPNGMDYLRRDVYTMTRWFRARGLPPHQLVDDDLVAMLCEEAGLS
ncbi:MAG: serine protein kinase RIO [Sciscionella sp.]